MQVRATHLARLEMLARNRQLPMAALINEAIENYMEYQAHFLRHVEDGLEDIETGRVLTREQMEEIFDRMLGRITSATAQPE